MGSKASLFLALGLLAVVLLISSEATARDLSQASTKTETSYEIDGHDSHHGGYGGGHRGSHHGGYGSGHGGKGRQKKGHCRHGCCDRHNYGISCGKCCSYAGEAADVQTNAQNHN